MMKASNSDFSEEVKKFVRVNGLHEDLQLAPNGVIRIRRFDMRADDYTRQFSEIDLSKFWLPGNEVYKTPVQLLSRSDLVCAVFLFLNDFLDRTRSTKGRHDRARVQIKICIKFFEYVWLQGCLSLSDVTDKVTNKMAKELAQSGWTGALQIIPRVSNLVGTHQELKCSGKNAPTRIALRRWLGTNIEGSNYGLIYHYVVSLFNDIGAAPVLETKSIGFSSMRQVLDAINRLYGLHELYGLKYFPYESALKIAQILTPSRGRTPNIGPKQAAQLFSGAFMIIMNDACSILHLLRDIADSVINNFKLGRVWLGTDITKIVKAFRTSDIAKSNFYAEADKKIATGGDSVRALVLLVMSACFVVLAVCNARRRDEIQHRKYGVHYGCATVVNDELKLYAAEFYIEKTLLDYSVFYVNKISYRAIEILEAIQDEFYRVDLALGRAGSQVVDREKNLFTYRRLSKLEGIGEEPCWFNFDSSKRGYVKGFLDHIFPDGHDVFISSHMFRRLYGLLFIYRHEMPDVQALMFQYMHDSLSATFTYITDPNVGDDLASICALYGTNPALVKKAYNGHCEDMQETILELSRERLKELVEFTLQGGEGQGGFSRFLKTVYKKYMNLVEFRDLSFAEQTSIVSNRFLDRGHLPNPFRHSMCMASTTKSSKSAHCMSEAQSLRPELASPKLCSGCPFQYLNSHHIGNMREDKLALEAELSTLVSGSITWMRVKRELDNLVEIIGFHDGRYPNEQGAI